MIRGETGQGAARGGGEIGARARRAAALAGHGRHGDAVAAWERLNRLCPGEARLACGLGAALLGAGRAADALAWLSRACGQHPSQPELLRLQAQALLALGLRGPAVGALYLALELDSDAAQTHAELGKALFHERQAEAALPHCKAAFRLDNSGAHAATLSCVLIDLGRYAEALAVTSGTRRADSRVLEVRLNQAIALQALDRGEQALAAARAAVAAAPKSALARHHLAALLLGRGALTREAWALYEARSGLAGGRCWPEPHRRWTGGDIAGRTVLLHAEQGLGDTIQFVRYAPLVAARGARVLLAVQPALVRLLQGTEGVDRVVPTGSVLPAFDLYCPLLSLPGIFGTTLATIPPPLGYNIKAESGPASGALAVGLVWAGSAGFVDDRKRSIEPSLLAPLADVPGVVFHNLQLDAPSLPFSGMRDATQGVGDLADTASRIADLDLVIAVDTAVAHLAATLGKPVWLLSRFQGCWRWLQDRDDSPWYPSMRIYRQTAPNDWAGVIARVRDDLGATRAGGRRSLARELAPA